ncbi:MAG: protein translocase subunit SecF [Corynebacteriales bacterium]|nr:protein translocase subunit SecF [Mycobacteriales bacterium]
MMGLMRRLYRGETNIDFIGTRKRWYIASVIIALVCIGSMAFRGFEWGIEFAGGTQFVFDKPSSISLDEAEKLVEDGGAEVQSAQVAGQGGDQRFIIKTADLADGTADSIKNSLADETGLKANEITVNSVSSSWGEQVTKQGLIALAAFLVLVSIYIAIRFEQKMAIAAIGALLHDLLLTAGAYSLIGFEVTPSTVIGLLTILGFSLYDTVVVFDKVDENTKGLLNSSKSTYAEAANLAVNQSLMRAINTSLISLLPVGALLFVGAGLLGVGTLKDLALVLFVGLAAGAYSSLFLATPWLVDLKEREPRYKALRKRVLARRAQRAEDAEVSEADEDAEEGEFAGVGGRSRDAEKAARDRASETSDGGARRGKHGRTGSRKRGR